MTTETTCKRIDFPTGPPVWFEAEPHGYYKHNAETGKRSRKALGVTTAVKTLDTDPEFLMRWAAKHQIVGAAKWLQGQIAAGVAVEDALPALLDADRAFEMLEAQKLTYREVNQEAKDTGTRVHRQAFEALVTGSPMPDLDGLSERERGLADAVHRFVFDHHLKTIAAEQVVYSARLGVAGTPDLIAELGGGCEDETCPCHKHVGSVIVLDLKTGNFIAPSLHAQVGGGYPLLATECGIAEPEAGLIVKVREDGTYTVIEAQADRLDFESAVVTYRTQNKIKAADTKAYKKRKEARA